MSEEVRQSVLPKTMELYRAAQQAASLEAGAEPTAPPVEITNDLGVDRSPAEPIDSP